MTRHPLNRYIASSVMASLLLLGANIASANEGDFDGTMIDLESTSTVRVLLEASTETTLMSPMVGQIKELNTSLGKPVKQNDVLVRFVCDERIAQLAMSKAEWDSAQANYETKERLQRLRQAGDVEVAVALNGVSRAKAQYQLHQAQVDQCTVKAPFNGFVVKAIAKPFQGVLQSDPLLTLVKSGPLTVRLNAPAPWVNWLQVGTKFKVRVDEVRTVFDAQITALNARIDPVSQTIELEGELQGSTSRLLPGMSGIAQFESMVR